MENLFYIHGGNFLPKNDTFELVIVILVIWHISEGILMRIKSTIFFERWLKRIHKEYNESTMAYLP